MPTPSASSPRPPVSPELRERALSIWKRIVHAVTWRFPVKFAALALALTLWVLVSAEEQTEAWVDVKVQIITDSSVSLVSDVPEVQALVGGRGRELLKLYTTGPAIRRVVGPDTPNEVTVDLRPGDVIIPGNADVRVRDVTPRSITLAFEVTEERYLPVRPLVQVITDSGLRITSGPRVLPGSVLVKGPRRAVRGLGSITTDRLDIFVHDTEVVRSVTLDTTGLGLTDVTPSEVRVRVRAERLPPPPPVRIDTTPADGSLEGDSTAAAPRDDATHDTLRDDTTDSAPADSAPAPAAAGSTSLDDGGSSDGTEAAARP